MKKRLKIIGLSLGTLLLLTLLGVFIFRENIVSSLIDKYVKKVETNYNIRITYNYLELDGVGKINLSGVYFTQEQDTLARLDSVSVTFPFWKTVLGGRRLTSLNISNGELNPFNYKAQPKDTAATKKEPKSKIERIKSLTKKVQKLLPDEVAINNVTAHLNNKMGITEYTISSLELSKDTFNLKSSIIDTNDVVQPFDWGGYWAQNGVYAKWSSEEIFRFKLGKGEVGFNSLWFNIGESSEEFIFQLEGDSLLINHYRIAEKPIYIEDMSFGSYIVVDDNSIRTTNKYPTRVGINGIEIDWDMDLEYSPSRKLYFSFSLYERAQEIIDAMPKGLFKKIDKLKAEGYLGYDFLLDIDFNNLDSLVFESKVDATDLKIKGLDRLGLTLMNDTFTHTVKTDKGTYSVGVGDGLPYFTPIEEVPRHLIDAILTNEDPSFFRHRGFIESAFRESLIANIKERRFKRGASTISMQLVKNLFLTKEKTLARKIEEVCLVWILENKQITPKERMFEVYLNIIEWGPGIYGIEQASEFYFKKKPSQLTLEESLYLASIIPRPKSFKYTFDKQGNIRPHYVEQFRFIKDLMVKRELISPQDTLGFNPNIQLKGEARKMVLPDEESEKILEKVENFFDNLF